MPCSPRNSRHGRCGGRGRHHPYMMGPQFHPFFPFMNPAQMEGIAKNMEEVAKKMAERSQQQGEGGAHPFFPFMNPEHMTEMAKNMEEMAKNMAEKSQQEPSEQMSEEGEEAATQQPKCQPFFSFVADVAKNIADNMPDNMEEEIAAQLFPQKNKTRWNESEDTYAFKMDVPGVRPHQIVIEEKAGDIEVSAIRMKNESEIEKSHQESFFISPSKADLDRTFATLIDGVLTITIPKKANEPIDLIPESATAPPESLEEFRATLDLPGVKPSALKVQAHEAKVFVEATRQVGNRSMTIKRVIEVQPPTASMAQARVFLQDGVFTLVVPTQNEDAADQKPAALRTIYVAEDEVPEAFASLSVNEGSKNEEDLKEAMVVETVTNEEEKEGWEKVNEEAK